jgi:phosphomannomutase
MHNRTVTLRSQLTREPRPLKFGTSGRRGRIVDLTQLEIYITVLGELTYFLSRTAEDGGIAVGDEFYTACDLRPSSPVLCEAVHAAVRDAGLRPVHTGSIPTPALACYALSRAKGSIMVTGSHIPFDWNGYKLNTSKGELLKSHEGPINEMVDRVRQRFYSEPFAESKFDERGALKLPRQPPKTDGEAGREYARRYGEFFAGQSLDGMRVVLYQHSAAGRDLLLDLLRGFGAEVIPAGRSDTFVPIDTENIDAGALAAIQQLLPDRAVDAVVSTDGDSDRPLILGVDRPTGEVRFFPGDLVGMIAAEYLGADSIVVPISCNDAIDRGRLAAALEPKTRIGSPYVIAGMEAAARKGRFAVCGWEANGGFLVGSDIRRNGRTLRALPTRDAVLPILTTLFAARERRVSLVDLFARLPARFTSSTLIRNFPRSAGLKLMEELNPSDLEGAFGHVAHVDRTDGLRVTFESGDVIHLRPSGNADEFRIYACADDRERASAITREGSAFLHRIAPRTIER